MKPNQIIEMPLAEADADLRQAVARWYCDVFNDPETFGDSWTLETAVEYLFGEAGKLSERIFMSYCDGRLAGVAIVVMASAHEALTMRELPPEFRNAGTLKGVCRQVEWFIEESSQVMVFREIGIHDDFRGDIEHAMELIVRPIAWAVAEGADFGCFWTSRKSPLYRLLRAYDIRDLYDFGGDRDLVFMGDDPRGSLRRFRKSALKNRRLLIERLRHQRLSA